MTKCRKPEVSFPTRPEAGAGGADHVAFVEQLIEEVPAGHAAGGLEPDVGGIDAAENGDTGFLQTFTDDAGVLHVVVDDLLGLLPAFIAVNCSSSPLYRIGSTIELGGGAAQPEAIEL